MVRDAAVARLTVIGARAEAVLAGLAGDRKAPPAARLAALRVLEATAAPAGCELGLAQLDDPAEDIVRAAIAALRPAGLQQSRLADIASWVVKRSN